MNFFFKLIIAAIITNSLLCQNYLDNIPKFSLKQTGLIKMSIGSLIMFYGGAQFGIPVPFFSANRFESFSTLVRSGILAGTGFTLFESGLSNYHQETNVALEPRSIIHHWEDHFKKAVKYSMLITAVPLARFLNK
ncbi:hypothetical protein HYX58_04005 [Candidatus Dependentiae bacterium]|nr:hypothetical protein [Candidatus Dependentiae bacterium]